MKQRGKLQVRLLGLTGSITRFPLTAAFLLATAVVISFMINRPEEDYSKLIITFVVGTFLSAVSQVAYERFFDKTITRIILGGVVVIIAGGYYLLLSSLNELSTEVGIRTIVIVFASFIAFLWLPVIRSKSTFNESFMATFKAFFIAVFYAAVLFLGVSLIIGAIDMLITSVDENLYLDSADIIFVLFAPMYFLSLIPLFSMKQANNSLPQDLLVEKNSENQSQTVSKFVEERKEQEDYLLKASGATKFLETLISYVIIPITAIFTIILLLYIIINITGSFWTDNLLEPMLVSYSITVIIVYLLAARLNNAFARIFRRIFPKVLVPIVLFQTISSLLKIGEMGITYGRYFVIMFGVFATVAGILFCILSVHKNGIIAPILLVLSLVSIVPPVDAFTISRVNQTGRLENALRKNNMLEGNAIIPNTSLSEEDRQIIASSVMYLNNMKYIKDIEWLASYNETNNFEKTFGFKEYELIDAEYKNDYFNRKQEPIPITGYDFIVRSSVNYQENNIKIGSFKNNGLDFTLRSVFTKDEEWDIVLIDENNNEILRNSIDEIFNHFIARDLEREMLSTEEATFTEENDLATLTIIIESINNSEWENGKSQYADINILVKIK